MGKKLINSINRDEYLYIILISFFVYAGTYFAGDFRPDLLNGIALKIIVHFLLLLNSFVIFEVVNDFLKNPKFSCLISALYVVSPTHSDAFLFFHQLQPLVAETGLILSMLFLRQQDSNKSFLFLVLSVFLNTKLILFLPFYLYFRKTSEWQKIFVLAYVMVACVYSIPLFHENQKTLIFRSETLFYLFQLLSLPMKKTIIDFSFVVSGFYSRLALISFSLAGFIFSLYWLSRKKNSSIGILIPICMLTALLGSSIPLIEYMTFNDHSYYLDSTSYPTILFIYLISLIILYNYKKKLAFLFAGYFFVLWVGSSINFQMNTIDIENHWTGIIYSLPENFNKEEEMKLEYAQVLISNNALVKAEEFINITRKKFPKEQWYKMAIDLAKKRRDQEAVDELHEDLYRYQVPFRVD